MKILPFTLMILILFGIISYSSFQRATDRALIYSSLQKHIVVSRALENRYQTSLFHQKCMARKKREKGEARRQISKKPTKPGKPKQRYIRPFAYKINLNLALYEGGIHREIAEALLFSLYPDKPIAKLLDQLTEAASEQPRCERPEDLATLQFELRPLWITLLQGDLLDQITVHPDEDPHIYIAYASKELLSILFDDPDAMMKKTAELKHLYIDLSKRLKDAKNAFHDQLKSFAEQHHPNYQEWLSYTINYKPPELTFKERKKQIVIKRRRLTIPTL